MPSLRIPSDRFGPELVRVVAAGVALFLLVSLGASLQRSFWLKQQISTLRDQNQQLAACHSGAHGQCDWGGGNLPASPHQTCSALLEATRNLTQLHADENGDQPHSHWTVLGTLSRLIAAVFLAAGLGVAYVLTENLDTLPHPVQAWLRKMFQVGRVGRPSGTAQRHVPLSKLMAYSLDRWFSTRPNAKPQTLLFLTLGLIYLGGLGIYIATGDSLYDSFWQAIQGVGIDWTFAEGDGPGSRLLVRLMAVGVSVGGMLITALMLGIVSDAIGDKIEAFKKGKSDVLESEHSLILGWSDKLLPIIDQLCQANASEGGRPIVVLAERDKEAMEEDLAKHGINEYGSRVIFRTGNPLLAYDLAKVSAATARSIIVLATSDEPDQADARTLRVVLSLMGLHDHLKTTGKQAHGLAGHIVAEVTDLDNEKLLSMVGGACVETLVSHDIIGRMMIQCARQPGLANVWEQIMGFEGDEFYMRVWDDVVGRSFRDVLISFPTATPIGIKHGKAGCLRLNPPDDYIVKADDQIIVLAEDDDTYEATATIPDIDTGAAPENFRPTRHPEKVLFVGWRRDMDDMIMVLDEFVPGGSELWLYNEVPVGQRDRLLIKGGLDPANLKNLKLVYKNKKLEGEMVNRKGLEDLEPEQFNSILILADESEMHMLPPGGSGGSESGNIMDADSRNLASLLLLRDIQTAHMKGKTRKGHFKDAAEVRASRAEARAEKRSAREAAQLHKTASMASTRGAWYDEMAGAVNRTVIISEILDSRTRHLIQDVKVSEFVLSNELVSMALAMVSENRDVNVIQNELFTDLGNELYLMPPSKYLREGETLSWFERSRNLARIDGDTGAFPAILAKAAAEQGAHT
ncbi:hypothetical protein WJX84_002514 [Apatococcus fuscideae]|uniref:RCK N-terminal domain-containing protein n=1 Tax=Apatococcus fuscideae TaxID=2026836 RepID=A0AAW1THT1_9CHLO